MLHSRVIKASSQTSRNPIFVAFEQIDIDSISKALATQRELGLPNYYTQNGRIVARAPNGRFVTTK